MNRFRRILTRWTKKAVNYEGLLHFCLWPQIRQGKGIIEIAADVGV